jgi:hypothetical protein
MMRKLACVLLVVAALLFAAYVAHAAEPGSPSRAAVARDGVGEPGSPSRAAVARDGVGELSAPERLVAGTGATLHTRGSGQATLWIIGPSSVEKKQVRLGESVDLEAQSLRVAGRYLAVLRQGMATDTAWFYVSPAAPANVDFLARPSRVPVDRHNAISGVAFLVDAYRNLVLDPTPVRFSLSVAEAPAVTRVETSKLGLAWVRLDSTRKQGAAQFVAAVGDTEVRRVVQQTASDPCNLRMKAERSTNLIVVETDPVRDCSGNPVPDGTIVTFTQVDSKGRSTVDARVKKGIARAELPQADNATISVASGVVLGNELHLGGGR